MKIIVDPKQTAVKIDLDSMGQIHKGGNEAWF